MTVAIRVVGLGKRYDLERTAGREDTLREAAVAGARALVRRTTARLRRRPERQESFWALHDVSFDVRSGEAIAIVGGNGAGKSTLLKLLARITAPTTGRAEIRGRIGSLLEVGTGFHPDLSGRENVFLNGAILGMRRAEITRRFDEIVDFAEVARFIDTPVKRYSSGMYMRLAFAVAAHLEPDVLLVDEVLAVGDAAFQQKCLGKMGDATAHGRTVLFVSHNVDAVRRLCPRAVLLQRGRVVASGRTPEVLDTYLAAARDRVRPGDRVSLVAAARTGTGEARFTAVRLASPADAVGDIVPGAPVDVELTVEAADAVVVASFAVTLRSLSGVTLVNADTLETGRRLRFAPGATTVRVRLDALHLNPGQYALGLWMSRSNSSDPIDYVETALHFEVVDRGVTRTDVDVYDRGFVRCDFSIAVEPAPPGGADA